MRRISVRSLMVVIVGTAVGLAGLRNANKYWAAVILTGVELAVATSVVGALALRGREQCGWAGFAVFSGVYLVVAIGNIFPDEFKESLGTTAALKYIQSQVTDQLSALVTQRHRAQLAQEIRELQDAGGSNARIAKLTNVLSKVDTAIKIQQAAPAPAIRWLWLPGATNGNEFLYIGHSLFALLSGLIGTAVGKTFYARRERNGNAPAVLP
jgi:hypothetical protein